MCVVSKWRYDDDGNEERFEEEKTTAVFVRRKINVR